MVLYFIVKQNINIQKILKKEDGIMSFLIFGLKKKLEENILLKKTICGGYLNKIIGNLQINN